MKSIKNNIESFLIESIEDPMDNVVKEEFDPFFSADIVETLQGKASLEIQDNNNYITKDVKLIDVEYEINNSNSGIVYRFILENEFDNKKILTISISKIENPQGTQSFSKYYIYEKDSLRISYKFVFKYNK
ncbi:hypothetical protein UAY_02302 [Enterococcus moraviensis ATCC BAA-383]|uniref:Uncharacterized protein n=1 Tax=Enterococcus moraviensis ATCC BAA-383 TaxID=1158609 RepID=R2QUP0_9ENTE|nr:hypothetical protein [Enterococcus moraviensis]EOH99033.1 hypothetical protein UAY_02302 [Enterococcus moraviensis ATCC BAA-383]EOT71792.1 hypothetical protein I586_01599 [Enterococcus moraviensis ATCC BAA-383]OJG67912.1 hypothetical protein RV09_GL002023 [Enterococcus moraviensis]